MKNLLLRYKWIYLILTLAIIGFLKVNTPGPLNYNDMLESPNATFKDNSVSVFLGSANSPVRWGNSDVKISDHKIYITASWSLREHPNTILIELPDPAKAYQVFWVDDDGKITGI